MFFKEETPIEESPISFDKSIFEFDFEMFFQDGSWRDWIKGEAPIPQGENQMASAPSMGDSQNEMSMQLFNKPYNQLNEMELNWNEDGAELGADTEDYTGVLESIRQRMTNVPNS